MSKISLSNLSSGFRSSNKLNENFQQIRTAFDNTLSRDGSTPNQMLASIDMNSNRIINVGAPKDLTDVARLKDVIGSSINGPRVVTLESLGAAGDGTTDDTAIFTIALTRILEGWTVVGQGNYLVSSTITVDADRNVLWQSGARPRMGKLVIEGAIISTHAGIVFDLKGNQGGAAAATIEVDQIIGPGVGVNATAFRLESGGHCVRVREMMDYKTGVLLNGAWSFDVHIGNGFACETVIKGQLGTVNASTNNAGRIHMEHCGGPFNNNGDAARAARSAKYGLDLDHCNGLHVEAMAVQYCQMTTAGIAVRIGPASHNNTFKIYGEGVLANDSAARLLTCDGYDNQFDLSGMDSPNSVLSVMDIRGLNNKVTGFGSRIGDAARTVLGAEMGAGEVNIFPGNTQEGRYSVAVHRNLYSDPANIHGTTGLGAYTLLNCTRGSITNLPDLANIQPGESLNTANSDDGAAVSPTFTVASAAFDRPIYITQWVRLSRATGRVGLYLTTPAGAIIGLGYSTGLVTSGVWQKITVKEIIPAGTTQFRLRRVIRNPDNATGCTIDWSFPVVSWYPDLNTVAPFAPPVPDFIPGRGLIDPIIPLEVTGTVTGGGVLDCSFAPLVRVTSASAGVGAFANLSDGITRILNNTGADFNILTATGIPVVRLLKDKNFVTLYKKGANLWIEN